MLPGLKARLGWSVDDPPAPSYRVGERIDLPASLYTTAPRTVLLFTSASCGACQRSKMPTAALVHDLKTLPNTAVVMVTPPSGSQERVPFARELGVPEAQVAVHAGPIRLQRMPAVVVVDSQGTVLLIREGMLTELDQKEVLQLAGNAGPPGVIN